MAKRRDKGLRNGEEIRWTRACFGTWCWVALGGGIAAQESDGPPGEVQAGAGVGSALPSGGGGGECAEGSWTVGRGRWTLEDGGPWRMEDLGGWRRNEGGVE